MKTLTEKQQIRARGTIFKRLALIGFKRDTEHDFWYIQIDKMDLRICMGFNVHNLLGNRRIAHWSWQTAKMNERPAFGYSGTMSSGASFGTVDHIISCTMERIFSAGVSHGIMLVRQRSDEKIKQVKDSLEQLIKALP